MKFSNLIPNDQTLQKAKDCAERVRRTYGAGTDAWVLAQYVSDVFALIEQPNYPATCDNCGEVGTNQSMTEHLCADAETLNHFPCSIGEHQGCVRQSKTMTCPCICHQRVKG